MNLGGSIKINKCAIFLISFAFLLLIYIFASSGSNAISKETKNQSKVNLRKLVIGLILAAKQGGKEVIKVSKQADFGKKSKGKTKEGVDDPVTGIFVYLFKCFDKVKLLNFSC